MEGFSLTRLLLPTGLFYAGLTMHPLTGPFGYFEWGLCGNGSRAVWSQWYVLAHTTWAHQEQSHQPVLWQGLVTVCCSNDWHVSRPGIFHMGNFGFFFSISNKSFLPNLSNLGNTNSPDIIIKVKNVLKCQLHDFSRGMSSDRAKMLLYGKCLLCLTGTSWSSSVLRGRMGPQAVFSVEFSHKIEELVLLESKTSLVLHLLTGPILWQKGSCQQGCPMECCPLWCITQGTATCFLREKWKAIYSGVWIFLNSLGSFQATVSEYN